MHCYRLFNLKKETGFIWNIFICNSLLNNYRVSDNPHIKECVLFNIFFIYTCSLNDFPVFKSNKNVQFMK